MSARTVMSMDATARQDASAHAVPVSAGYACVPFASRQTASAHAVSGDVPAPGANARKAQPRSGPTARRVGGFTLIELLVAVALLAVLAILSWRGLDTVLQSRERLVTESNELRSLTLALAQLEEDLLQTWPVNGMGGGLVPIRVVVDQGGAGGGTTQSMMLVREIARRGQPTRLQRVVYQVRDGRLERGFSEWQKSTDGRGSVGGSVQSLVWQPILPEVRSMRVRAWIRNNWVGGAQLEALTSRGNRADRQPNDPYNNARYQGLPGITATTPAEVRQNIEQMRRVYDLRRETEEAITGIEVLVERTNGQRFLRIYSIRD